MTIKLPINLEDLFRQRTVEDVHADTTEILLHMRDFHRGLKLTEGGEAS